MNLTSRLKLGLVIALASAVFSAGAASPGSQDNPWICNDSKTVTAYTNGLRRLTVQGSGTMHDMPWSDDNTEYYVADPSVFKEMWIAKGVLNLGPYAGYRYSALTNVEFEAGSQLTSIAEELFMYSPLESIEIPAGVEILDMNIFYGCSHLKSVTFAPGSLLQSIGFGAFSDSGIESIVFPASLKNIGMMAFANCSNLSSVTFESTIDDAYNIDWDAFNNVDASSSGPCTLILPSDWPTDDMPDDKCEWHGGLFVLPPPPLTIDNVTVDNKTWTGCMSTTRSETSRRTLTTRSCSTSW